MDSPNHDEYEVIEISDDEEEQERWIDDHFMENFDLNEPIEASSETHEAPAVVVNEMEAKKKNRKEKFLRKRREEDQERGTDDHFMEIFDLNEPIEASSETDESPAVVVDEMEVKKKIKEEKYLWKQREEDQEIRTDDHLMVNFYLNEPIDASSEIHEAPAVVVDEMEVKKKVKKEKILWKQWEEEQEKWIDDHIMEHFDLYGQTEASSETHEAPANLIVPLFRHQKEWLGWALNKEESSFKGGILADEMGMGKTLQAIALVLAKREILKPTAWDNESSLPSSSSTLPQIKSTLVVCPPVAVTQWVKEIENSTIKGCVKVLTYVGPKRDKKAEQFSGFDFVITTYGTIVADCQNSGMSLPYYSPWSTQSSNQSMILENHNIPARRSILHSVKWERIILDEAHIIKNRSSYTTRSIHSLKSAYKWALSGTPMPNRADELYSLIIFLKIFPYAYFFCKRCNCGRLESSCGKSCEKCGHTSFSHFSWWNKYVAKPIRKREQHSERGRRALILLRHKVLRNIMLRRTKKGKVSDVALPSKTVVIRWDTLSTDEEERYKSIQRDIEAKVDGYIQAGLLTNKYVHILPLITRLRQAVNHPDIGVRSGTNALESGGVVDNNSSARECGLCLGFAEVVAPCTHVFCKACVMDFLSAAEVVPCPSCLQLISVDAFKSLSNDATTFEGFKSSSIINRIQHPIQTSTKLEALREEIRFMIERDGSAKGIVCSQFINFLDLIKYTLEKSGVKLRQLVGCMSRAARDAVVKQFTEDPDYKILLLSFGTGGVAVNLTVASHFFLMDPWWNSGKEDQAMDRVHRIGQYKPIRVVRFLIEDTIEERVYELQHKKKSGFEGTIGESQEFDRLTEEDLKYLFCSTKCSTLTHG